MSELGQRVIAGVRLAATVKPDYVYPRVNNSCLYIEGGCPSCLVGQGLWFAGLIDANWNGDDAPELGSTDIASIVQHCGWDIDHDQVRWLAHVQANQDIGESWGNSVALADTEYPL